MILGVSSRTSSRPFTTTMASSSSRCPYCAIVFGNTITSSAAPRSSSTNVRHEVAALVYLRLQRGDDAADGAHLALARLAQLGERAVDVAPQRPLGAHHRVLAHVEAEHLLLEREPLRLRELGVGDLGALPDDRLRRRRRRPRRTGRTGPRPRCAGGRARVSTIVSNTSTQALARMAERVERARLDQRLDRALVEHRRVDAVAEVVEVGERPALLARGDDVHDHALADVAHRRQAEADRLAAVGVAHREVGLRLVDVGDEHRRCPAGGTR